ncbi:TetR/AcrR family transcriptional regulator [Nocardiopsis sp. CNT312]|uniref:TetR/AcrR family transcriptional regulator n=1 Tax=Nocardiopsis sp. CNT312 TaxID=1137268 RepID=UPI00048B6C49|nr:TetR family transcriptional regulator [Nocardiopsis sp. CNT312]
MAATEPRRANQRPGGRRPGRSQTREAILAAAREQFAAKGYTGTTFRGIAAQAGVDPALVRHFYGTKDQLFAASMHIPTEVFADVESALLTGGPHGLGERLARTYLGLWDDPATAAPLAALVRTALTTDQGADLLRNFLQGRLLEKVTPALDQDRPRLRAELAVSHLIGTALARYVLRVEPIASLETDELVAVLAPALQRYLTGTI